MKLKSLAGLTAAVAFAFTAVAPPVQAVEPSLNSNGAQVAARQVPQPPVNSGWLRFQWIFGPVDQTFSFTTKTAVRLTITDAFCRGDAFTVLNGNNVLVVTPTVASDNCSGTIIGDPDVAYRDPSFSHGSVVLKPGSYVITIVPTVDPFGNGAAFIRFDFPPTPL